MTHTTIRMGRPWVAALLAGALAAITTLLMAFGSAAGAQTAQEGPDLALKKTVYPRAVEVGERQTFTIRITNEGTGRAEEVKMTDPLPSKVKFIRATTSREVPGSCGIEDRVVTCRLGTLRPDRTVTVKIHVKPVVAGSYTNRAYVSHGSPSVLALESDDSDNSDAARGLVDARRP